MKQTCPAPGGSASTVKACGLVLFTNIVLFTSTVPIGVPSRPKIERWYDNAGNGSGTESWTSTKALSASASFTSVTRIRWSGAHAEAGRPSGTAKATRAIEMRRTSETLSTQLARCKV